MGLGAVCLESVVRYTPPAVTCLAGMSRRLSASGSGACLAVCLAEEDRRRCLCSGGRAGLPRVAKSPVAGLLLTACLLESHFHVRSLERLMLKVVTEVLSPWGMKNVEGKSEKLYLSCTLSF